MYNYMYHVTIACRYCDIVQVSDNNYQVRANVVYDYRCCCLLLLSLLLLSSCCCHYMRTSSSYIPFPSFPPPPPHYINH